MVSFAKALSLSLIPLAAAAPAAAAVGESDLVARNAPEGALYAKDAELSARDADPTQIVNDIRDLFNEIAGDIVTDVIKFVTLQWILNPVQTLKDDLTQVEAVVAKFTKLVADANLPTGGVPSVPSNPLSRRVDASALQPLQDIANQLEQKAQELSGDAADILGQAARLLTTLGAELVKVVALLPAEVVDVIVHVARTLALLANSPLPTA